MHKKRFLFFVLLLIGWKVTASDEQCPSMTDEHRVDMVIYSFDRPLQLYALLESIEFYMTGLGLVSVIYRVSNDDFGRAYQEVEEEFSSVRFLKQGSKQHQNFKSFVLSAAFESPHDYIVFAVDDIIVKDFVDLRVCVRALKETGAYGFFLRLGKHVVESYMRRFLTPPPPSCLVRDDIYRYQFKTGSGDWNYPNSNDMTVYKKSDVKDFFVSQRYRDPTYEGPWSGRADHSKYGLFFELSKMVNVPMNLVQTVYASNRFMREASYSTTYLLEIFNRGLKIDIHPLFRIKNPTAHMDYDPTFVIREC